MKWKMIMTYLACLLALVLIVSCAPGASPAPDPAPQETPADPTEPEDETTAEATPDEDSVNERTLTIYLPRADEHEVYVLHYFAEAAYFEAANPGLTFDFVMTGFSDFDTFFKTAVAANEQIDLVEVNIQFYRDYVQRGFLSNITDRLDFDAVRLPEAAWDQMRYFSMDDYIYGVPLTMQLCAFYYNVEIFERFGLDTPTTWDDVFAMQEILAEEDIFPMVYAGAEHWWNGMHFNMVFYQFTNNNALAHNDRLMAGDFSDEVLRPYIETFEFFARLENEGVLMPGTQGMDSLAARTAFTSGEAAMHFMGSWFAETLIAENPDFEFGVFPAPILAGSGNISQAPGSVGDVWSVFSGSAYSDDAIAFIEHLVDPAVMSRFSAEAGNFVNIVIGAEGNNPIPQMAVFEEIAPSTTIWLDAVWEPEIIQDFYMAIQSSILGDSTPTELMDAIVEHYIRLREQGRTFIP